MSFDTPDVSPTYAVAVESPCPTEEQLQVKVSSAYARFGR